ncbi:MAG: SET domain-containing protein [Gammaproteobacteria bacterium]|nr:MAG: SET domain-containing protein [Gammaproteobacteria bacterium]
MSDSKRIHNRDLKAWVYAAESSIHGTGLFAARAIAEGEYIGTYWGPQAKRNGTYVLWVYDEDDEENAVGRSGRNLLRYLNHSRPGNTAFDGFDLYAARDIAPHEELTFDYLESDFD